MSIQAYNIEAEGVLTLYFSLRIIPSEFMPSAISVISALLCSDIPPKLITSCLQRFSFLPLRLIMAMAEFPKISMKKAGGM